MQKTKSDESITSLSICLNQMHFMSVSSGCVSGANIVFNTLHQRNECSLNVQNSWLFDTSKKFFNMESRQHIFFVYFNDSGIEKFIQCA